jgi:hypothetical protein
MPVRLFALAYAALCAVIIARFAGTGDPGDSISHYLAARHAFAHPALFFDHWSKPVFVLLAAPFAQFGFAGIKVFNAVVAGLGAIGAWRTARALGLRNALLAAVFTLAAPMYLVLTFSGLTEPLFACVTVWVVVAALCDRPRTAAIAMSFLPMVRSEGLVLLLVMAVFLLLRRQYRVLPWLALGTGLYGLAGWPVHGHPLWPITGIPYAHIGSPYGSGTATHFLEKLVFVVGVPLYALLAVGTLVWLVRWWRDADRWHPRYLVPALPWAYIVAHTLFWWAGIFNSMGLTRVLVGVVPLLAVLALGGLAGLVERVPGQWPRVRQGVRLAVVGYVLVFPFTPNPAAIQRHRLEPSADQALVHDMVHALGPMPGLRVVARHPYIAMALDRDPFAPDDWAMLDTAMLPTLQPGDVVIWDEWFAPVEGHVQRHDLEERGWRVHWSGRATAHGRTVEQVVYMQ